MSATTISRVAELAASTKEIDNLEACRLLRAHRLRVTDRPAVADVRVPRCRNVRRLSPEVISQPLPSGPCTALVLVRARRIARKTKGTAKTRLAPSVSLVERCNRLVALTASPHAHEAGNAAVLACRIIRDNAFVVAPAPVVTRIDLDPYMTRRRGFSDEELAQMKRQGEVYRRQADEVARQIHEEEKLPPLDRARAWVCRLDTAVRGMLAAAAQELRERFLLDVDTTVALLVERFRTWSRAEVIWTVRQVGKGVQP